MKPVIKLDDIHKTYQTGEVEVKAVRGVSLEIFQGEFVALMGASGSGKSTMMNTLGCLDRPTGGKYFLDDIDVSQLKPRRTRRHPQSEDWFYFSRLQPALAHFRAGECRTAHALHARATRRREPAARALKALETVGLGQRADHTPNQLSGGQQQRVAIARALANEPALLLADEPTGNLDTRTSIEIMGVFQKLNDQGITIVMVTHELDIAQYTKRMVVMRDGKVVSDTPVEDRLNAEKELGRLQAAQEAAQLAN